MNPRAAERCAERLLAEPGLQHDEAQAALAATFSVTALDSPSARLDEASPPLFGAAPPDAAKRAERLLRAVPVQPC
ncbi:MAG TPA: hypothetical protein VFJ57_06485 [Solirubrobacterales bacterium]|nr:hypothetical protein [Solirubrobacterales bacterium]